jgi:hypothetical protein
VYVYLDTTFKGNYDYSSHSFSFKPIYVGKGKGNRYQDHLRKTARNLKTNLYKRICYIRKKNKEPLIIIFKDKLTDMQAINLEKKLIKIIGRKDIQTGHLLNRSGGGQGWGISGKRPSISGKNHYMNKLSYEDREYFINEKCVGRYISEHLYKNKVYSGTEISKIFKINISTFYRRLSLGWSVAKSIENPIRSKNKLFKLHNQKKTLKEWCVLYNISYSVVHTRVIQLGWDLKRSLTTKVNKPGVTHSKPIKLSEII